MWLDFEPVGKWFECGSSQQSVKDDRSGSDGDSDSDKENAEEQTNPLLLDPSQWKVWLRERTHDKTIIRSGYPRRTKTTTAC